MKHEIEKIGKGSPIVGIIGCVHGDEIIGKKVIQELKKIKLEKGSINFIIANAPALKKRKRFLKKDLNRSFPGKKNGIAEEKLAYSLKKEIKKYDIVIDIHATNSNFQKLAIISKLNKKTKELLKITPIKKVGFIKKTTFGGNELITHSKLGIALEYGPDKTGKNYKMALRDTKIILKNLGVLKGKKKYFNIKELYTVKGTYTINKNFRQEKKLKDFKLIKKNQIIGEVKRKKIKSSCRFYPLFLGKGKYQGTLALMSNYKKLNFDKTRLFID